jgi:hypothetical protein
MLQNFIPLKNPLPWSGLNPQTLGPIAITITITPLHKLKAAVLLQEIYKPVQDLEQMVTYNCEQNVWGGGWRQVILLHQEK